MNMLTALLQHIADAKTPWTVSAFAIAALVLVYLLSSRKSGRSARPTLWAIACVIFALAFIPIAADAYLQRLRIVTDATAIYRVRVTVVDDRNTPVEEARVRVNAANESKTAPNGDAELAIPKASLPQNRTVTIFVDKDSAFQHGRKDLLLADDPNPSVIIPVLVDRTGALAGDVEDEAGHRLAGARVSIPGQPAVVTGPDGNFSIPAAAAAGQKVLLHAEKSGYGPVSQYHPAGDEPVVLVLSHNRR